MKTMKKTLLLLVLLATGLLVLSGCNMWIGEREQALLDAIAIVDTMYPENPSGVDYVLLDPCETAYPNKFEEYVRMSPHDDEMAVPNFGNTLQHIYICPYRADPFVPTDYYWCHKNDVAQYQLGYAESPQMLYARGDVITMFQKADCSGRHYTDTDRITHIATTDPAYSFFGVGPQNALQNAEEQLKSMGFSQVSRTEYVYVAVREHGSLDGEIVDVSGSSREEYESFASVEEYYTFLFRGTSTGIYEGEDYTKELVLDYSVVFINGPITVMLHYDSNDTVTHMEMSVALPLDPEDEATRGQIIY